MKKILITFLLIYHTASVTAQQRSLLQAKEIAYDYISCGNKAVKSDKVLFLLHYDSRYGISATYKEEADSLDTPFYILSDSDCVTIVAGDERMNTILGHAKIASKEQSKIPDGLMYLLESYKQQYELLKDGKVHIEETNKTINIPNVEPMLKTKWRQEKPFNDLCPRSCPSGCVATAMSQVMNYHKYPDCGNGSFSYSSRTRNFKCTYDFENSTFYWDSLKNTYPSSTLGYIDGAEEIAQITYACGVSVGMDYDSDGSGAYMSDVPYALINFFGYNNNVSFCDRTCYDAVEWYEILCHELTEGRPVIYGGVDSKNGGHAFVIDGCNSQTRKFHINWGWGGEYDGDYELDALNPSIYRFSSYQDMIINVSPTLVGYHRDVFYADKFSASEDVSFGKDITFSISDVYCYSSQSSYVVPNAKFYGEIGVGVFDKDFNFLTVIDSDEIDGINNFYGYSKVTFTSKLKQTMFSADGVYYIAPYVKEATSSVPTRIRTTGSQTDYIAITVTNEDVNGNNNNDEPQETISAWHEDFEYTVLPTGWNEDIILGNSEWKHRYVLIPSEEMPMAAEGRGYIYLDYATAINDKYNNRTVTRLETSTIPLSEDEQYNISLQCRKHATMPEATDIITLYCKIGSEWITITEIPITNQGEWNKTIIELPFSGSLKLAFEGSPSKGSTIYLDDLNVYERNSDTHIKETFDSKLDNTVFSIYNAAGAHVKETTKDRLPKIKLNRGVYILRNGSEVFKVLIK